jgi:nucleoside-diphosphate-sugar epimerase
LRVLLVDVPAGLAGRLRHDVSTLDDARDRDIAARAVGGVDAVVCGLPDGAEALDRASRGVFNLIVGGATRIVLLSSLRPFERYPLDHRVTEYWAPRPTTDVHDLVALTAEGAVREAAHTGTLRAVCLRLGTVVEDAAVRDPRAVHVDDVAQAVERALTFEPGVKGWRAFHVVGAGRTRFPIAFAATDLGYTPAHDVTGGAPLQPLNGPEPRRFTAQRGGGARRVVIFGAGGPLAAISAQALERDHVLRLCDLRSLADIVADGKLQSRGAPVPRVLGAPHETRVVDVTEYDQVVQATRGMDAVINMTVMRHDPVEAFRVNTIGAYNVVRAAVECGIRRVVQTGPQQVTNTMPGGYWSDVDLSTDVPPRPGVELYFVSKFLGHEIVRVFAQEHDLEAPTLVFGPFTNPLDCEPDQMGCYPFLVSWADAAEAVRGALRAPSFPRPFEMFHIVGDLPHGRYQTERTQTLLHWQPRDNLDVHWRRTV